MIMFCDASFDYLSTNATSEPFVRGKIAISDGRDFNRVERVAIGKVDGLRQYINILELTAICRAVELAHDVCKEDSLSVRSDSMVALAWAKRGKIPNKIRTQAHVSVLEYLAKVSAQFYGTSLERSIEFIHVGRDNNPAGKLLEAELLKEPPHTV